MHGNYQKRRGEKSSNDCICDGIPIKTWATKNSAMRFVSICRMKFPGWKEASHGVVKAQTEEPQLVVEPTTTSSPPGEHEQGNITRSAKDTAKDNSSLETPPGGTLNQGRLSDGLDKLKPMSRQSRMTLCITNLPMSGPVSNATR